MKILWLSHFVPYPPKGGILQRGYNLLKHTAKCYEVHLLAFNQKALIGPLFNNVEEGVAEAKSHLSEICESVEILPLPLDINPNQKNILAFKSLFNGTPYTMSWLASSEFSARIQSLVKQYDFDFVHFDTISLTPFKQFCSEIPSSLDHHNIESHMLLRRAGKETNWLKKLYFFQEGLRLEKAEKHYCPTFDFNFTCSGVDSQRLLKLSPDSKVHTIPNGVDTGYFSPRPLSRKEDRLIFVGTLSWYPNIEAVMFIARQLWPLIKKAFPHIQVDIIGVNPPPEIVELSKSDAGFNVHGFVDDVRPYLKQAKCYVCPVKDGGGTKLKILDAMSMGMAIVADEIACEGIEVVNNESVIFATTPQEYLAAITNVLRNDDIRSDLESEARNLAVQKYSYDQIGTQLVDLFAQYRLEH